MNKMQLILVATFILVVASCSTNQDIQTGFADVNGTKLYYEVSGKGEAVVLIHGNYGDLRHWDKQIKPLSKDFKLIRYDVRGFGKSAMPVEGEPYKHEDDLKALLDYLDIEKANIVGFSMGSVIAGDFVLTYPDKCLSFIPVGPWLSGFYSPLAKEVFDDFSKVAGVVKDQGVDAARGFIKTLQYLNPHKEVKEVSDYMHRIVSDFALWGFTHQDPGGYMSPSAMKRLDEFHLPTLIITADYDIEACKELAGILENALPNARKVVVKDASHIMMLENPSEFNRALIVFLRY